MYGFRDTGNYAVMLAIVATCSLLGWLSHTYKLTEANIVIIFLAGVAVAAARCGRGPAIGAAIISVLVFDFFFVNPPFSFVVSDTQYFITLGVMLGIGLLISALTSKLQVQLRGAETRERRTAQLFQLTKRLSELSGEASLLQSAGEQLKQIFNGDVAIYLCDADRAVHLRFGNDNTALANDPRLLEAARQACLQRSADGAGMIESDTPETVFAGMSGAERMIGVLGVRSRDSARFDSADEVRMFKICAHLVALSLERDRSNVEAHRAQLQVQQATLEVQSEKLRNSLLNSISHDMRTPLATIAVTASSLLDSSTENTLTTKRELLQTVVDESHRMSRQVENLLELARLSSGVIQSRAEWEAIEELIEAAMNRLRRELEARTVKIEIDQDFPPLWVAGELLELVFVNLLENAVRYTPANCTIEIIARNHGEHAEIVVADNGPGLPAGSEAKVFQRYFRGGTRIDDGQRGLGLGLAICKSIVLVHGGQISATNRVGGGAQFTITLPCEQPQLQSKVAKNSAVETA